MRFLIAILLLSSCSPKYKVVLDGSKSFVEGGNGKGEIVKWEWRGIGVVNRSTAKTFAMVGKGTYWWELIGTDNLGNKDSAKCTMIVK